jgi:hypothetical protein
MPSVLPLTCFALLFGTLGDLSKGSSTSTELGSILPMLGGLGQPNQALKLTILQGQ